MDQAATIPFIQEIMTDFARRTGLEPATNEPRRYLWTDAFAVCNYLSLYRLTGEQRSRDLALQLVDQVHHVLGRHRGDDQRQGWISGLDEEEGALHPTAGGLRIGKKLKERGRNEAPDPFLEWEQDGQYYHYLTKWMHALSRVSEVTGDPRFLRWAMELGRATHPRFTHSSRGNKRMYWKMSIDLSYPLVTSMGQHDALDGYVTYRELQHAARRFEGADLPDLGPEIEDMAGICRGGGWATDDALGAGALLIDAWRVAQMYGDGDLPPLLKRITSASLVSVGAITEEGALEGSAGQRLAFRELGLAIGLEAVEILGAWLKEGPGHTADGALAEQVDLLQGFVPLAKRLERFWADPRNRLAATWKDHEDINAVMLATGLAPSEFLRI